MLCSQSITVLKSHGRHGYMYMCRQEYWDRHERAADVLNGVHVEHRLAMGAQGFYVSCSDLAGMVS